MKESSEKTIVITTHDLDLALETCQRVILLAEGKIIEINSSEIILKNKVLLETNNLELPLSTIQIVIKNILYLPQLFALSVSNYNEIIFQ